MVSYDLVWPAEKTLVIGLPVNSLISVLVHRAYWLR